VQHSSKKQKHLCASFVEMTFIKRFDHIGVAVRSVDEALKLYRDILGGKVILYKLEGTTRDYTYTQFELGGQRIELIEPIEKAGASFLTKFLEERGEGLHHLTFQVDDILEAIKYLKANNIRIVDEFFEDPIWKVAFISPRNSNGILIQLYETQPSSPYDHSDQD